MNAVSDFSISYSFSDIPIYLWSYSSHSDTGTPPQGFLSFRNISSKGATASMVYSDRYMIGATAHWIAIGIE